MAPKVLVSDKLSETAVQIFRDRGVDVDYLPDLGKDKDKLLEVIGQYDGLAIRSATKVTEKILAAATQSEGDRPRRDRRRQRRYPGRLEERCDRDEHTVRQLDHHRRTRHRDDVRRRPPAPRSLRLDPCGQVGEEPLHGGRALQQDARRHRRGQHRRHRLRPRAGPPDEGHRLRSLPLRRPRQASSAWTRWNSTNSSPAPTSSPSTCR